MLSYNAVIPMMVGSTPPKWGPPLSYKQAPTWVDWVNFLRVIPPQFEHYVGTSKDMGKRLPQLYYVKMKISYLYFIAIGVAMTT